jgi:hypothetical protein
MDEEHVRRAIGPRVVGGRYRNDYWGKEYTVRRIDVGADSRVPWSDWSITVEWSDGKVGTHCTAWGRRDQVLAFQNPPLVDTVGTVPPEA